MQIQSERERDREKENKKNKRKFFFSVFRFFFDLAIHGVYVCVCVCACVPLSICLPMICLFSFFVFLMRSLSYVVDFWLWRYSVTQVRLFIKSAVLQHSSKVYYQIVFFSMFVFVSFCLFKVKYMCVLSKKNTRLFFIGRLWQKEYHEIR